MEKDGIGVETIRPRSRGSVVADDWCIGSRYFWDLVDSDNDPLRAIAKRYLGKIPSSFMLEQEERFKHTVEMAKQFDVEAAIIFILKFTNRMVEIESIYEENYPIHVFYTL